MQALGNYLLVRPLIIKGIVKTIHNRWQGFFPYERKHFTMRGILYLIAVVLVIIWVFQFFFSGNANPSGLIHILLVLAVISLLIGIIKRA